MLWPLRGFGRIWVQGAQSRLRVRAFRTMRIGADTRLRHMRWIGALDLARTSSRRASRRPIRNRSKRTANACCPTSGRPGPNTSCACHSRFPRPRQDRSRPLVQITRKVAKLPRLRFVCLDCEGPFATREIFFQSSFAQTITARHLSKLRALPQAVLDNQYAIRNQSAGRA